MCTTETVLSVCWINLNICHSSNYFCRSGFKSLHQYQRSRTAERNETRSQEKTNRANEEFR
jgi:hypothetical protein